VTFYSIGNRLSSPKIFFVKIVVVVVESGNSCPSPPFGWLVFNLVNQFTSYQIPDVNSMASVPTAKLLESTIPDILNAMLNAGEKIVSFEVSCDCLKNHFSFPFLSWLLAMP
jgi:hypothetical protein